MKKLVCASALIGVIALSASWTGFILSKQRPVRPLAGLLHRSTVDSAVDSAGHSRGIVQVGLLRQILAQRARLASREAPATSVGRHHVLSQDHSLLNKPAPGLVLKDAQGRMWDLRAEIHDGPVVVVFYLGSTCMACMTNLTGLDVALWRFRARGVRVLAVSGDTPEFSAKQMRRYGDFQIPLLSDADRAVALSYGVWKALPDGGPGDGESLHGTFIVDRAGLVRWVHVGDRPFDDIEALLTEIDELDRPSPAL